jgi:hypothetical protein
MTAASPKVKPINNRLWSALNSFISQQGGWLVSVPYTRHLRIETVQGSTLPTKLQELGYDVRQTGKGSRIDNGKFIPIDILEVSL